MVLYVRAKWLSSSSQVAHRRPLSCARVALFHRVLHPLSVRFWRNNWNDLTTLFRYCPLIRKAIYSTNAEENFHRQLRKVIKSQGAFVSEGALMKMLYLTTMRVSENGPIPYQAGR